jgi:broad specificity polyphosphatase/5'/3'-nucleotidase SurE
LAELMLIINQHTSSKLLAATLPGWSSVSSLETRERSALEELICVEVRINDLREDGLRHERAYAFLDEIAWSLTKATSKHAYLIKVNKPSNKSRIKSHNGIFPRGGAIRESDYYEEQIDVREQSFFVGTVKLDKQNRAEAFSLAHDRFTSIVFFAQANTAKTALKSVLDVFLDSLRVNKLFSINFPRLVSMIVNDEQSLLAFGGDGAGSDWLNITVYSRKSLQSWVEKLKANQNAFHYE